MCSLTSILGSMCSLTHDPLPDLSPRAHQRSTWQLWASEKTRLRQLLRRLGRVKGGEKGGILGKRAGERVGRVLSLLLHSPPVLAYSRATGRAQGRADFPSNRHVSVTFATHLQHIRNTSATHKQQISNTLAPHCFLLTMPRVCSTVAHARRASELAQVSKRDLNTDL